MHRVIKFILFLGLISISLLSNAQILDDSTHLEYGAFSTKFYTEDYLIEDSVILETIDSSFLNQHEYDGYYAKNQFYQNLGNTITPSFSLVFKPSDNVLYNLSNDRYANFRFNKKRYFNTQSPYTFIKYTQGSRKDQILEGLFTQNINPRWNIGSEFYRGVSRKQYATNSGIDKLSSVWSVRGFTSYISENKRYHFLGDVETQNSKMNEQYGIIFSDLSSSVVDNTIDQGEYAEANYDDASNEQKYRSFSIKQRYDIVNGYVGIYSKHRYRRDKWMYRDDNLSVNYAIINDTIVTDTDTTIVKDTTGYTPNFYKQARYSTDSTYDEKLFDSFENEVGIYVKSDLWHLKFGYLQQWYGYENNYQSTKIYGIENVLKGEFNYRFVDMLNVNISTQNSASGAFNTLAKIESKYGDISYNKILSKPFLTDNFVNTNHLFWSNDFKHINSDVYALKLKYSNDFIRLMTNNSYTNINNQIYYDTLYNPIQDAKTVNIIQSGNFVGFTLGKWNLEQNVLFTSKNADFIQLPEWATRTRMYWLGTLGHGVINSQIGFDLDWRSNYYSSSYSPLIQNFYVQNEMKNFGYPLVDIFANMNIKSVDLFIKLGHVNQYLGRPGYLASAYYPAKRFNFAFGVKWRFFD